MKKLFWLVVALALEASVMAQAPYVRNAFDTNAIPGAASMTGALTITLANLTTITAPAMTLSNTTAATVGVQVQDSPALYWSGNAWLTGSASNAPVTFRQYVVPVAGISAPTGALKIDSSMNGGAFGGAVTIDNTGVVTTPGGFLATGGNITIAGGAGSSLAVNSAVRLFATVNGAAYLLNNGSSAVATLQINQPQLTKTSNYTIVALDSGTRFVNIGAVATNRLDLPTAASGMHFWVYIDAAQNCRLQATGSDVVRDGAVVSGAGGGVESAVVGSSIHVFSPKALLWVVDSKNGTWSAPAP